MSSSDDIPMEDNPNLSACSLLAFITGFFFSFRSILVLFSVQVMGAEPRTGAEIVLFLNLLLLGFVGFNSFGGASRTFRSMLDLASIRWVIGFLILSCCSLAWSATVSLSTSIAYWCGMTADVGIVVLLLRTGSVMGTSHSLMKGFIWSTCCLAVIVWIMPARADLRLGDDNYFNTNQIGNLCAFAIFMAQYLMRRNDGKWNFAVLFLATTLVRSLSKTTLVAFLLSESYLVIQDRTISRRTKILLTTGVILTILVFWGLFEAYYDFYTTEGNQAETLTGRTAIWTYVLNASLEQPWIGHGFDSMWKVVPPFGSGQFEARHAENELLQQFYAYGIAGLVMLGGLYGSLYREIRRLGQDTVKIIFYSFLLFIVVRGIAEAEAFDLLLPLWMIVLMSMLANGEGAVGQSMTASVSSPMPEPLNSLQGAPVFEEG